MRVDPHSINDMFVDAVIYECLSSLKQRVTVCVFSIGIVSEGYRPDERKRHHQVRIHQANSVVHDHHLTNQQP